jgi:hypothetical protein
MNMPRFTAEASLYKTRGITKCSRNTIKSSTQMISANSF